MIRKIIHLSDLHFGTEIPEVVNALVDDCQEIKPDIIIISGDLTQRAKTKEFKKFRGFLEKLKNMHVLCVPGNHDIPLYNIFKRLIFPFTNYRKWVSSELCIHFKNDMFAVLGINSATPYKIMDGYVTENQLLQIVQYFQNLPNDLTKIIVMHHNLIHYERHKIINDADKILEAFARAKVNIILSGHIHFPCIELIEKKFIDYNMYVITAGTAISTRTIAPNSYNYIELNDKEFSLSVRTFEKTEFVCSGVNKYLL